MSRLRTGRGVSVHDCADRDIGCKVHLDGSILTNIHWISSTNASNMPPDAFDSTMLISRKAWFVDLALVSLTRRNPANSGPTTLSFSPRHSFSFIYLYLIAWYSVLCLIHSA